jgi:hypothetical protein
MRSAVDWCRGAQVDPEQQAAAVKIQVSRTNPSIPIHSHLGDTLSGFS